MGVVKVAGTADGCIASVGLTSGFEVTGDTISSGIGTFIGTGISIGEGIDGAVLGNAFVPGEVGFLQQLSPLQFGDFGAPSQQPQ